MLKIKIKSIELFITAIVIFISIVYFVVTYDENVTKWERLVEKINHITGILEKLEKWNIIDPYLSKFLSLSVQEYINKLDLVNDYFRGLLTEIKELKLREPLNFAQLIEENIRLLTEINNIYHTKCIETTTSIKEFEEYNITLNIKQDLKLKKLNLVTNIGSLIKKLDHISLEKPKFIDFIL